MRNNFFKLCWLHGTLHLHIALSPYSHYLSSLKSNARKRFFANVNAHLNLSFSFTFLYSILLLNYHCSCCSLFILFSSLTPPFKPWTQTGALAERIIFVTFIFFILSFSILGFSYFLDHFFPCIFFWRFERFLYDYLIKRNMHQTAEVFRYESNLQLDPCASSSDGITLFVFFFFFFISRR